MRSQRRLLHSCKNIDERYHVSPSSHFETCPTRLVFDHFDVTRRRRPHIDSPAVHDPRMMRMTRRVPWDRIVSRWHGLGRMMSAKRRVSYQLDDPVGALLPKTRSARFQSVGGNLQLPALAWLWVTFERLKHQFTSENSPPTNVR